MKKKSIIMLLLCSLLLMSILVGCSHPKRSGDDVKNNNAELTEALKKIDGNEFKLSDVTTFEWTTGYFFTPYADKKGIEQTMRIKSEYIKDPVDDREYQIFFINNDKIVAYLNGKDYTDFYFKYPMAINITFQKIDPETEFTVTKEMDELVFEISNLNSNE